MFARALDLRQKTNLRNHRAVQLLTNWWPTPRNIVMYNPDVIIGFRVASAPIEDLLFGFALILNVMGMWEYWGVKGVQKN